MEARLLELGLLELATLAAAKPGGREKIAAALRRALRAVSTERCSKACRCPRDGEGSCAAGGCAAFATPGVADALAGAAAGLNRAAAELDHVAAHALVILPPR
jgi:hypothetical protein